MSTLFSAGKKYLTLGLSIIATDNSKRSLFPWKPFQSRLITEEELYHQLGHPKASGLAVICGSVSGGLEVIDVDTKYALTPNYFDRLASALQAENAPLFSRLYIVKTKSGGYHLYYRCEVVEGNQKLAMRPPTDQERKDNPQLRSLTLIETRGEAGYVIAPPTDGYTVISGTEIPVISIDERETLLSICRSFNEYFEPVTIQADHRPDTRSFGLSPFDDYNKRGDIVSLLTTHGWTVVRDTTDKVIFKRPGTTDSKSSGDYNRRLGWFSVFTTNSCFTPNKAYQPAAVYAILECNGDFREAARRLADAGYGEKRQHFGSKLEREIFKRKSDGMSRDELIQFVRKTEDKPADEAAEIVDTLEKQWGDQLLTFWDINNKGNISINRSRLMTFLSQTGGFYIYFYDKNSTLFKLVRLADGFIEEASTQQIKEFIKAYILSLPDTFDGGITREDLLEVILKGAGTYFTDQFFEFFETITPDFLKSTRDTNYFPFQNGVVCITKKDIVVRSYGDLKKTVWKSRVIPFNVQVDTEFDPDLTEFYRFIDCISGAEEARRNYCLTLIGYLLHTYKDPAKPFAVILAEETENDKDGGGTGKGIFVKALSNLLRTVKLDGKNFKIDKSFALQRVSLDTQLISIEDCDKGLDFEKFNSQITEGSVVEKKNKDELFIDYKDSAKFIFSTNYMLNLKGNHGKRRSRVFEFSPFFSPSRTPYDHFGRMMFDEWDEDEWNRFYNLMFFCVSVYLESGIKEQPQTGKLRRKQVRVNFGEEFLDYLDSLAEDHNGQWMIYNQEYNSFLKLNEWDKKDYSNKRFRKGLEEGCEVMGWQFEMRRNRQNNGAYEFCLKKPPET